MISRSAPEGCGNRGRLAQARPGLPCIVDAPITVSEHRPHRLTPAGAMTHPARSGAHRPQARRGRDEGPAINLPLELMITARS